MTTGKRGRPAKNGAKGPEVLVRALTVLHGYAQARAKGEKYEVAVDEAVAFVRQLHPEMSISRTEVKRILAEFQPRGCELAFRSEYAVMEAEEAEGISNTFAGLGIPLPTKDGSQGEDSERPKVMKRWTLGIGERPVYMRHNAKVETT